MKKWQKDLIPIILDWVVSWFSKDRKKVVREIKTLKKLAFKAIKDGNYERYNEIMEAIERLKK